MCLSGPTVPVSLTPPEIRQGGLGPEGPCPCRVWQAHEHRAVHDLVLWGSGQRMTGGGFGVSQAPLSVTWQVTYPEHRFFHQDMLYLQGLLYKCCARSYHLKTPEAASPEMSSSMDGVYFLCPHTTILT